jgi:hypothetical protein
MAKPKSLRAKAARGSTKPRSASKPKATRAKAKGAKKPAAKARTGVKSKPARTAAAAPVSGHVWPGLPPGYFERSR